MVFFVSFSAFLFSISAGSKVAGIASFFILLCFLFLGRWGLSFRKVPIFYVFLFSVVLLVSFVTVINLNFYVYYFYVIFFVLWSALFYSCVKRLGSRHLVLVCDLYLSFHVAPFYAQIVAYYIFGYYIDFYGFLPGADGVSAYLAKELSGTFIRLRAGGFFTEPSFFAMSLLPFFVVKSYLGGLKGGVFWLSVVALFINFSIASILVSSIVILFIYLHKFYCSSGVFKNFCLYVFMAAMVYLVGYDFVYERLFSGETYDPIGYRFGVLNELALRDDVYDFFGAGFFLDEEGRNGYLGLTPAQIRDSGFFVSLLYFSGFFGMLVFLMFFVYIGRARGFLVAIFFATLCMKYSLLNPSFWISCCLFSVVSSIAYRGDSFERFFNEARN